MRESISLQHTFKIPSQFKLPVYNTLYFTHSVISHGDIKLTDGSILLSNTSFPPIWFSSVIPDMYDLPLSELEYFSIYLRTNFICIFVNYLLMSFFHFSISFLNLGPSIFKISSRSYFHFL